VEIDEPIFRDALFYQKRKHAKYRAVATPHLAGAVADTHAHLQMLPDPALALARCMVWGVEFVCDISDVCEDADGAFASMDSYVRDARAVAHEIVETTLALDDASEAVVQTKELVSARIARPDWGCGVRLRMAVGCHPHNAKDFDAAAQERLRVLLTDPRVCAIGEIGLDYHYDFSPRAVQVEVFRTQIRMAHELGLPISLHIREAHDEALRVLDEEGFPQAGVLLHCFNLDACVLAPWVERDCYIAFGGPLTFKASDYVRRAARLVPLNRLLTETDAPYMTPEPMRGMVCGPQHVMFTADVLAHVRACETPEQSAAFFSQLMNNAQSLLDREPLSWQTGCELTNAQN